MFASGVWIGVELHKPIGKNNGTVQGQFYFQCAANHGLFVREEHIEQYNNISESSYISRKVKLSSEENDIKGSPPKSDFNNRAPSPLKLGNTKAIPIKAQQDSTNNNNHYIDHNINTETEGQHKSNKFTALLKLKLSQLMDLLNQQLEIVVELESEHDKNKHKDNDNLKETNPKMLELRDEVIAITQQELELIESFRKRLFLTEI